MSWTSNPMPYHLSKNSSLVLFLASSQIRTSALSQLDCTLMLLILRWKFQTPIARGHQRIPHQLCELCGSCSLPEVVFLKAPRGPLPRFSVFVHQDMNERGQLSVCRHDPVTFPRTQIVFHSMCYSAQSRSCGFMEVSIFSTSFGSPRGKFIPILLET